MRFLLLLVAFLSLSSPLCAQQETGPSIAGVPVLTIKIVGGLLLVGGIAWAVIQAKGGVPSLDSIGKMVKSELAAHTTVINQKLDQHVEAIKATASDPAVLKFQEVAGSLIASEPVVKSVLSAFSGGLPKDFEFNWTPATGPKQQIRFGEPVPPTPTAPG